MKKSSLIVLLILIGFRGYSQPELENAVNAAAKIALDVTNYKNGLVDRTVGTKELETLESYYSLAEVHLLKLKGSGAPLYIKRGLFLDIILRSQLAIAYYWSNDRLEAYLRLKKIINDMYWFYNEEYFFPFRFKIGSTEYLVRKDDFKQQLIESCQTIGAATAKLKIWDESKLYFRFITKFPGVPPQELYSAQGNLIVAKKQLYEEDVELLDTYLESFRLLCYMKQKDRLALKYYVYPGQLYDSAKAISDRHLEFDRVIEVDSTGGKGFYELGDYARSAALFTKWLERGISSDPMSCTAISTGIQMSDIKLVDLAIKNLEKGFWGEYCFAFHMLKEGYEFLGDKKKARYWEKKDDKCMGR